MQRKICVIGAGFYGCHFAHSAKSLGHDVTVLEANDQILHGASEYNQLRIHQGFHYPRSHKTRIQSIEGYKKFLEIYPELSQNIQQNLYAVVKDQSLMDYESIVACLRSDGINFKNFPDSASLIGLKQINEMIESEERLFLPSKARSFFLDQLSNKIEFEVTVRRSELDSISKKFDLVYDFTYSSIFDDPHIIHELTLILKLDRKEGVKIPFGALTLIDGPFWSLYPTENPNKFSLSNVSFSPIFQTKNRGDFDISFARVSDSQIQRNVELMLQELGRYWPNWGLYFEFNQDYFLSRKVKINSAASSRAFSFKREGNIISVRSGKIDAALIACELLMLEIG